MSDMVRHYDLRGAQWLVEETDLFSLRDRLWLHRSILEQFHKQLANFPASTRVLDFCCGTGLWSAVAASLNHQVTAVDVSPVSIQAASKMVQRHKLYVDYLCADGNDFLRHNHQPWHLIWVSGSLYYFNRPEILRALKKHLKNDGVFMAVETNGSNVFMNLFRRLRNLIRQDRDSQTLRGLIRLEEFRNWRNEFKESEIIYLDFLTLLTPIFGKFPPMARAYHRLAARFDNWLLNTLGFNKLAFKVFFKGQGPVTHE